MNVPVFLLVFLLIFSLASLCALCWSYHGPAQWVTDASIHALVGDGKHGRAERIQTFRCQACRITFTRPSRHPVESSENPFPAGRHGPVCTG